MSRTTVVLAKLIGLYTIAVAFSMALHKDMTTSTIDAIVHEPDLILIGGMVGVIAGLAIVLTHNIWSGGTLPVVITVIGWAILARGLLALVLPPEAIADLVELVRFDQLFYLYVVVALVLGLYLTYAGFTARRDTRPVV